MKKPISVIQTLKKVKKIKKSISVSLDVQKKG